ncbi:isochorismatase family protein [Micromonospora thermarum]|uniref:Isochorismatase family protein n=1 Tax=Micromonospora thermarum TaxID=2720024 RepID=A0ABX0Z9V4_9ACTN|nr:isochorismatase family protein [Micromonospora thermarum]NJP32871.1 isochorismatase family protein [Micromonospora thermarum]
MTSLFTPDDAAMLLIDHQTGTMRWAASTPFEQLKSRALALARAAKALDMPLVLTSSLEEQAQGPLLPEFADIAPAEYVGRIRRQGAVDALHDPAFSAAVEATGKRNLIVAGVTNDVCTVYPVLTALRKGYRVQVVADAGASITKDADDIALRRMARAGADITSTNQVLAELAADWSTPAGQRVVPIMFDLIPA